MNTDINPSSQCYVGAIDGRLCCFFAVLHFPHNKVKNFKRGHRLVVLPDYQGLGIGHAFSSEIADIYKKRGCRFIITSSTKSLFKQRARDSKWLVTRKGRTTLPMGIMKNDSSSNKLTYSYEYVGDGFNGEI